MSTATAPERFKVFRWRAIGPLLLFFLLVVVLWMLFADALARRQAQDTMEEMLGTQVDLDRLTIRESDAAVDLAGLAIADPRDPMRNLLEAGGITTFHGTSSRRRQIPSSWLLILGLWLP